MQNMPNIIIWHKICMYHIFLSYRIFCRLFAKINDNVIVKVKHLCAFSPYKSVGILSFGRSAGAQTKKVCKKQMFFTHPVGNQFSNCHPNTELICICKIYTSL